jgi:serine/threonine protein kinase
LLGDYLGGTEHSAVFATEFAQWSPQKAAIKLIPGVSAEADRQLERWKRVSSLSHDNILQILDYGTCQIDGTFLLYVVMEHADESLKEILPNRLLSAEEARAMIVPVLDGLHSLHLKRFVHSRVHPGNILAVGDNIKLSSDAISPEGETVSLTASLGDFSPPEGQTGVARTAMDVWSFGATLIAALTRDVTTTGAGGNLVPPASVPEPFARIAEEALKASPSDRITINGIRAQLNLAPMPAPAAVRVTTMDEVVRETQVAAPIQALNRQTVTSPAVSRRPPAQQKYIAPAILAVAAIAILLFVLPRAWHHKPDAPDRAASYATRPVPTPPVGETSSRSTEAPKPIVKKRADRGEPRSNTVSAAAPAKQGQVLEQVLPPISQKARDTIRGKVRVAVRVHANAEGAVESAALDAPASSQFFADKSVAAARAWKFAPGGTAGDWEIRFVFTPTETHAEAERVSK